MKDRYNEIASLVSKADYDKWAKDAVAAEYLCKELSRLEFIIKVPDLVNNWAQQGAFLHHINASMKEAFSEMLDQTIYDQNPFLKLLKKP